MCAVGSCECSVITGETRKELLRMFIQAHDRSSPLFNYSKGVSYKRMPEKGFRYLGSHELKVLGDLTGLEGEELFREISTLVSRTDGRGTDEFYTLQYLPEEDIDRNVVDENVYAIYFWVNVPLLEFARQSA